MNNCTKYNCINNFEEDELHCQLSCGDACYCMNNGYPFFEEDGSYEETITISNKRYKELLEIECKYNDLEY